MTYYDKNPTTSHSIGSLACMDCERVGPVQVPLLGIIRMGAGVVFLVIACVCVGITAASPSMPIQQGIFIVAVSLFAARIGLALARTHALARRCPACGGSRLAQPDAPAAKRIIETAKSAGAT
jgi:hypothetical protein